MFILLLVLKVALAFAPLSFIAIFLFWVGIVPLVVSTSVGTLFVWATFSVLIPVYWIGFTVWDFLTWWEHDFFMARKARKAAERRARLGIQEG